MTLLQYGTVESTVILVEKGGSGLSRGCAFVNFAKREDALAAIAALDNQVTLPGGPYTLRVSGVLVIESHPDHCSRCMLSMRTSSRTSLTRC